MGEGAKVIKPFVVGIRSLIGALALISIFYPSERLFGIFWQIINAWDKYIPKFFLIFSFTLSSNQSSFLLILLILISTIAFNFSIFGPNMSREQLLTRWITALIILFPITFYTIILVIRGLTQQFPPNDIITGFDATQIMYIISFAIMVAIAAPAATAWLIGFTAAFLAANEIALLLAQIPNPLP